MRLTEFALHSLKPRPQQYAVFDDVVRNFGVRVGASGQLSFFVMYRQHGRRKRDTLGRFPIISLAEARHLARQRLARLVLADNNPEVAPTVAFGAAAEDFVRLHCAVRNKPRTAEETERLLRRHWLPALARQSLREIRTQDVSRVLDRLIGTPSEAVHALAAVRKFFNWARQRRLVEHSPCAGLQLDVRSKPRTRVLSDAELVKVYRSAEASGYPHGCIVQLLLLTAQRRNEIASLRWSYINTEERLVTLPAELVKNRREHVFVYGSLAACIFESLPRIGDMLFPARGSHDRAFSGWSKSKRALDRRCGIEFTLHDLRRTWATRAADLGVHPWVIEAHLNHVSGVVSGVSAIYNRYSYLKEARAAVALFDQRLSEMLGSGRSGT